MAAAAFVMSSPGTASAAHAKPAAAGAIARYDVGPRFSEAAKHAGEVVYLAGQVPEDGTGPSVASQTASVLRQIDAQLAKADSDKTQLLSVQVYLVASASWDEDVAAFNAVWDLWVPAGHTPPRATVGVACLVKKEWKIEIVATAAAGGSGAAAGGSGAAATAKGAGGAAAKSSGSGWTPNGMGMAF